MKVSVSLSQRLGAQTIEYAQAAAALGFDGVFVFDHLVPLANPAGPALEAAATLGALAATCPTRVGSLVLRATLRPPEVTAAIAASVAAVAAVPPVIGLGAGDGKSRPETVRFDLPFPGFAERLAVLGATVEAVQAAGVTAWVGGAHPAVVEVARMADGWNLWEPDPGRVEALLADRPANTVSWAGRVAIGEARPGAWMSGPAGVVAGRLRQLGDVGFDEVVLAALPPTDASALDRLAEVAFA